MKDDTSTTIVITSSLTFLYTKAGVKQMTYTENDHRKIHLRHC